MLNELFSETDACQWLKRRISEFGFYFSPWYYTYYRKKKERERQRRLLAGKLSSLGKKQSGETNLVKGNYNTPITMIDPARAEGTWKQFKCCPRNYCFQT